MASRKALDTLKTSLAEIKHQAEHREKMRPALAFDYAAYRAQYEQTLAAVGRDAMTANALEHAKKLQQQWDEVRNPTDKSQ